LIPLEGATTSQASLPRIERITRLTVKSKLQVTSTGLSGTGFPISRKPGSVGQGARRNPVCSASLAKSEIV
jgi:hypothetical protein